jgi:two-component system sensor histidine kinase KdpD
MLTINNNYKFENFAELISKAFNARTREALIEILYEHLPKIFEGKILIFLPGIINTNKIQLQLTKNQVLNQDEKNIIVKIKKYYEGNKQQYPVIIDNWSITNVKIQDQSIFIFVLENDAHKKLDLHDKHKQDILSVVASIFFRIDALEEELENNIQIEQEKLRSQILSSVSHDLKTPLAAIIGSLNILTSMDIKISDDQKKQLIETSVSEANRLNSFVTNILSIARIESGAVKAKMEWHNVEDIIKHIQRNFRIKYPDRKLTVHEIDEHISFNIDAAMFEQVMMIILDNGVKYSASDMEIEMNVKEKKSLNFIIRDHGKGVPEEMLEKIFDKYSRFEMQDRKIAGTGLGLAIAKALSELQNMDISAYNHKAGGLVITLSCVEWKE